MDPIWEFVIGLSVLMVVFFAGIYFCIVKGR